MPDADGFETDEEIDARIDAMADLWDSAPTVEGFPVAETERIKADPETVGWITCKSGNHVYLNRDLTFFSPTFPSYADSLNLVFKTAPLRYSPSHGNPAFYLLMNSARWVDAVYFIKPEFVAGTGESAGAEGASDLVSEPRVY